MSNINAKNITSENSSSTFSQIQNISCNVGNFINISSQMKI